MSVTGHSDCRHPDDWYTTPAWCTRAILPLLLGYGVRSVLDPACGDGAILDVVKAAWPAVKTVGYEIDLGRANECRQRHIVIEGDALSLPPQQWAVDLIVMNPPFSLARPFLERAIANAATVACLLRLNFLGSQERASFWKAHPADVYIMSKRPSFAASVKCKEKKGCGYAEIFPLKAARPSACPRCSGPVTVVTSDSAEYAWFVFGKGRGGRWSILDAPNEGVHPR